MDKEQQEAAIAWMLENPCTTIFALGWTIICVGLAITASAPTILLFGTGIGLCIIAIARAIGTS